MMDGDGVRGWWAGHNAQARDNGCEVAPEDQSFAKWEEKLLFEPSGWKARHTSGWSERLGEGASCLVYEKRAAELWRGGAGWSLRCCAAGMRQGQGPRRQHPPVHACPRLNHAPPSTPLCPTSPTTATTANLINKAASQTPPIPHPPSLDPLVQSLQAPSQDSSPLCCPSPSIRCPRHPLPLPEADPNPPDSGGWQNPDKTRPAQVTLVLQGRSQLAGSPHLLPSSA